MLTHTPAVQCISRHEAGELNHIDTQKVQKGRLLPHVILEVDLLPSGHKIQFNVESTLNQH